MAGSSNIILEFHIDKILEGFSARCPNLEALEIQWDPATIRFSDKSRKFIDRIRLKCPRLKSLTLSDGKYYEMVKGNFERAECPRVIRTNTAYNTSIVSLLERFKDPSIQLSTGQDKILYTISQQPAVTMLCIC
ncbi:F box:lrr repeat protein 7 [Paragonimus kellicotti]|nr:F box:lrr repeat protein 7 [Paragonimus kellicotti]